MDRKGLLTLVLHSHIPYCRKSGVWPFGEEWVFEAMAETYIPVVDLLYELGRSRRPLLSLAVSPVLCEQLADGYMAERFVCYMNNRIKAAADDLSRHLDYHDDIMASLAQYYIDHCVKALDAFENRWKRDLVGALRGLATDGVVDVMVTAATNAYLPMLRDPDRVRTQMDLGIRACQHHLGVRPRAAWLPELGYSTDIGPILSELGLECILVDPSSVHPTTSDSPMQRGIAPLCRYTHESSSMAVLVRDDVTVAQVWSPDTGYPGDGAYREFHRRHEVSGIPYWRVTSKLTELGNKQLYDPQQAQETARRHAEHFCQMVEERSSSIGSDRSGDGIIVAPFDMELFGHWWHEGVTWLGHVLRIASSSSGIRLASVEDTYRGGAYGGVVELRDGSWGDGNTHSAWVNGKTQHMWERLRDGYRLNQGIERAEPCLGAAEKAMAEQARKELLLAEASDWTFLVGAGQAEEYASRRFDQHMTAYEVLARAALVGADESSTALLQEVSERNALFGWVSPSSS